MRIKQIYVSKCLDHFRERMYQKYDLVPYTDPYSPAIFYGGFPTVVSSIIPSHKSIAVVLWAGTDALKLLQAYKQPSWKYSSPYKRMLGFTNCFHICRSNWLKEDFDCIRMQYRFLPVSPVLPEQFFLTPLGRDVYCYGAVRKPKVYGGN
jgi:hypothetical protein